MLDRCSRPGCSVLRVVRNPDWRHSYLPMRRWFCSKECSDLVNKPVHWAPPDRPVVACGAMNTVLALERGQEHRFTYSITLANCEACKRTVVYKKALTAT